LDEVLTTSGLKTGLVTKHKHVLRGVFGPKRDGVIVEWRKLHNEKVNDLYF
jgi:hypothetical protein